ncbi:alpha-amylase family glycosyl hydrolase, partial [Clostridium sp.]|uniref:alpha-amylase family glycosyl hydrolase n=1 Tax=Clostridium sp. TaxID=1506 RepID=UPI00263334A2
EIKSTFGGSAWEYDKYSSQYYLHLHDVRQPDLNWENPRVRKDIEDMVNFWIDFGVDGFRLDVIDLISKDVDNLITRNGAKLHGYIRELSKNTFLRKDIITVGEAWGATPEIAEMYSNPDRKELSMVFQFEVFSLDKQVGKSKWDLKELDFIKFKEVFRKWQRELYGKGWNSIVGSNHDLPRLVSRWGNDKNYRVESSKMLATMLHMQMGTPYIYQGEEIGMTNVKFNSIKEYNDVETLNMYKERIELGYKEEEIMKSIYSKGRDNARTPMQWNSEKSAGFTTGKPWLPVNTNYNEINVEDSLKDKNSIFYYYKDLISLRRKHDVIKYGEFELVFKDNEDIFGYRKKYEDEELLVLCNFKESNKEITIPDDFLNRNYELLISNYNGNEKLKEKIELKAYEAIVYRFFE